MRRSFCVADTHELRSPLWGRTGDTMSMEELKARLAALYTQAPNVHMDISYAKPKLSLKDAEATITGVYDHIFLIEERSTGIVRRHSLQYADLVTGQIRIRELET